MPRYEIKVKHEPDIKAPSFTAPQMQQIAEYAEQVIRERSATGTNALDQPAKPLQPKYAKKKAAKGLPAVRDLRLSGNMLGSMAVLEADASHAKVGIKGATPFRKGIFNQNIDPWFPLSPHDEERVLNEKVRPIFAQNLKDLL